jgi:hypothetical protein
MDTYITNATDGISFSSQNVTLNLNTVTYQKTREDNGKSLSWNGYLPAGSTVKITIVTTVTDEKGNSVNQAVSETVTSPVVQQVPVTINWDPASYKTSAQTGNYVVMNNGTATPLVLNSDRQEEWAEVIYNGKAAAYDKLNLTFMPSAMNSGLTHSNQSVRANVVDTLNLKCEAKELSFYVDDQAFTIPSSSIQFENRGQDITIQLPEYGTINSVTIPGATVSSTGGLGKEFKYHVDWSGRNLIPTGSSISISYTDEAGHQGNGNGTVTRSSVSTPITFRIRPELNSNGYLNGRSSTLIVSGTACSCEPIRVTVANMSQSTNAAQQDTWSDSNGSWEVMFDMSRLPEDQDFSISAEYMDVSGTGYSITAKFNAFCASSALGSPVYEAMSHLCGVVEPGTAVALVINGDTQNYYEIQVDRFGFFSMDDVPMMFAGEDSFDIYVTDIAGNVSINHYEIEEPGDPFEVEFDVNPLGHIFYSAQEENSETYLATPVSASDFAEDQDSVEIPLLMGMSYEVGVLNLKKTENGLIVSSEIQVSEEIDPEDYRIENEKLYVYTSKPSIDDLKNQTGEVYTYGDEIPFDENTTLWIVDESNLTILADDIMELELYDYENSEAYVAYQEQ